MLNDKNFFATYYVNYVNENHVGFINSVTSINRPKHVIYNKQESAKKSAFVKRVAR